MLMCSMNSRIIIYLISITIFLSSTLCEAARAGRGMGGRTRGRDRWSYSRMPIIIHRTSADSEYDHKDGARIVQSSHFEQDYMLGRKISFFCMAQGLPRPEITWFKDGVELYEHKFFQLHEWPVGNDTIKSKMEIDPTTQQDVGYYECQANNDHSIDIRGFRTDYVME